MRFNVKIFEQNLIKIYHFNIIKLDIYMDILDIARLLLLLLPLALQPAVGFGLSNNTSPFVPIYHQLSPSSHSQHLKISFHFLSILSWVFVFVSSLPVPE